MAQGVGAARIEGEEPEVSEPARGELHPGIVRAACRAEANPNFRGHRRGPRRRLRRLRIQHRWTRTSRPQPGAVEMSSMG